MLVFQSLSGWEFIRVGTCTELVFCKYTFFMGDDMGQTGSCGSEKLSSRVCKLSHDVFLRDRDI